MSYLFAISAKKGRAQKENADFFPPEKRGLADAFSLQKISIKKAKMWDIS